MSIGGERGSQTTTTTTEPPEVALPHIKSALEAAQAEFLSPRPQYFPGQTYVPFSPQTEAALTGQVLRAVGGNPLVSGAQGYTGDVLSGGYLPGMTPLGQGAEAEDLRTIQGNYLTQNNPFFQQMVENVAAEVTPRVNTQFAGAGRAGSGLHAQSLAKGLSQGIAPIAYGDYGRERGLQESAIARQRGIDLSNLVRERGFQEAAAARAPGLAREDYYDIGQLANVGAQREALAEAALGSEIDRYNFGQNVNQAKINQYANLAYGVPGATTTGVQPTYRNPLLTGLGAISTVASLGGASGPFGTGGSLGG